MKERSKGMIVLLASAALVGVALEVQRHREKDAASAASASASASSSAAPTAPGAGAVRPPRIASRAEIERTIGRLEAFVKPGASDAKSPWALAHGLLAFGPELVASDGRTAVDVIGSFAEKRSGDGGKPHYAFPEKKDGQLVEPHRHLLVKTLLEIGAPLERELIAADGKKLTLAQLIADMRRTVSLPQRDEDWHHTAWLLSALSLHEQRVKNPGPGLTSGELGPLALARLERDHQVVTAFGGPPAQAFEPGTPLHEAKQKKTGIYGHSCGGLHLFQAVTLSSTARKSDDELRRLSRQLGVLAFRYEAERSAYATLLHAHPEHGLILRVQQLKFFGHLVESLTLARRLRAYRPETDGGKKLDAIARNASADVVDVVAELDRGGAYLRLAEIRKDREQTYLDMIGDGCHAIHGLRDALALHDSAK